MLVGTDKVTTSRVTVSRIGSDVVPVGRVPSYWCLGQVTVSSPVSRGRRHWELTPREHSEGGGRPASEGGRLVSPGAPT